MVLPFALLVAALNATAPRDVLPADDAARVEELLHPVAAAPPPAPRSTHAPAPTDASVPLLGRSVHVRTVDGGLYAGVLQRVDADALVLQIDLPAQGVSYTLPRYAVVELESLQAAP